VRDASNLDRTVVKPECEVRSGHSRDHRVVLSVEVGLDMQRAPFECPACGPPPNGCMLTACAFVVSGGLMYERVKPTTGGRRTTRG
jgi:hypothetical protein